MHKLHPWLVVALLPIARGATEWYEFEYEYNYVEALFVMVFVALASVFDAMWHQVKHVAEHTYAYGDGHHSGVHGHDAHGRVVHLRLWHELANRIGGEWMTLGFCALTIFLFNQAGGFELVVEHTPRPPDWHYPHLAEDYLHIAEFVHVKVSAGMCFYFLLMSSVVHGSSRKIRGWEICRLQRVRNLLVGNAEDSGAGFDPELADFCTWRKYFVGRVNSWKQKRPRLHKELLEALEISADADCAASTQEALDLVMRERFSFASYLAVSVERSVADCIEVHWTSWGFLFLVFFICAWLHRHTDITLLMLTPFFIALASANLVGMRFLTRRGLERIHRNSASLSGASPSAEFDGGPMAEGSGPPKFHQRYQTELGWVRNLQASLFFVSYMFGRTVFDVYSWKEYTLTVFALNVCFGLVFMFFSKFLSEELPLFLAIYALPPFEDSANIRAFHTVLLDDHLLSEAVASVRRGFSSQAHKGDAIEDFSHAPSVPGAASTSSSDHGVDQDFFFGARMSKRKSTLKSGLSMVRSASLKEVISGAVGKRYDELPDEQDAPEEGAASQLPHASAVAKATSLKEADSGTVAKRHDDLLDVSGAVGQRYDDLPDEQDAPEAGATSQLPHAGAVAKATSLKEAESGTVAKRHDDLLDEQDPIEVAESPKATPQLFRNSTSATE